MTMTREPQQLSVLIDTDDRVSALLYLAARQTRAGITLILGHGAGANQLSPFMRLFAAGLAQRGIDALTFNFQYMEQHRRVPDKNEKLEACYAAVIAAAAAHKKLPGNRLVIGGKSMGGRIATQVAARQTTETKTQGAGNEATAISNRIEALVLLGYPLHPPGNPAKLRDAHLKNINARMLFVQGSRDAFGTPAELSAIIKRDRLQATLYEVAGGDHSLKVPKSAGLSQSEVYETVMNGIVGWINS